MINRPRTWRKDTHDRAKEMRDSGGDESVRNQFVTTFDGKSSAFATIFHSTLFRRSLLFGSDAHTKRPKREKSHHKSLSHSELHVIPSTLFGCVSTFLCLCANARLNCWWQEWRLKREQKTLFRHSRLSLPPHTVAVYINVYGSEPNQKLHSPRFDSHFTLKSFSLTLPCLTL